MTDIRVSRILHAGYIIEEGDTRLLFDPIFENPFSVNCYAYPNVDFDVEKIKHLKFSAIFISHFHDDHCSLDSLHLLDRETPIYMYCLHPEMFWILKDLGFQNVHSLVIDQPIVLGNIEIIPRKAENAEVDSMFHIRAGALNILNVVDAWIDDETLQQLKLEAPWDLVLWPFQTMLETDVLSPSRRPEASLQIPSEWLAQLKILRPRYVVPSSCQFIHEEWSWYRQAYFPISYQNFKAEVEEELPDTKVVRLNPSQSVILNQGGLQDTKPLDWIVPIGEQEVDYQYDAEVVIPSTAKIAIHFSTLTESQSQRVYDYCNTELLAAYRKMEPSQDPYFEKPRVWQLSLYESTGEVKAFYYLLNGSSIEQINDSKEVAWYTEAITTKVYAALELGESLSSMYLRINDKAFSSKIEEEIKWVDVLEDPLIRCLFYKKFATYQRAQLHRIQALV